jgi:hypothetical protein
MAMRLLFTGSREEYEELQSVPREEFRWACDAALVTSAGRFGVCRLFRPDLGDLMDQSVDLFTSQGLWSRREAFGVAAGTNHSQGLHGRINHKTAGGRSLACKEMMAVVILDRKVAVFLRRKGDLLLPWALRRLKEQARTHRYEERAADVGGIMSTTRGFKCSIFPVSIQRSHPSRYFHRFSRLT